ncbi:MAG TPA: TonB-dependent receptor, partial [Pyrinomonadaceae bacterium]|nr:TonB-dependent receptor [Pyrinomonadaceae bacterium]
MCRIRQSVGLAFVVFTLAAALVAGGAIEARAQGAGGSVRVQAVDELGGALINATVVCLGADGVPRPAAHKGEGVYEASGLPPGKYTLNLAMAGFSPGTVDDVEVVAGRVTTLKVTLRVTIEEAVSVEVQGDLSTAPEDNAGSIVIRGDDLDALPDDPEDLTNALRAMAGPSAGPGGAQFYVDGFSASAPPSKQSIREVRINQNPFSAEYDRLGFARVDIFTRAGANDFHGQGFFNFGDESLNSRNPFAPRRFPWQARNFGGGINGPLVRNRTSFFLDFERRETDDNALINATVLDDAFNPQPLSLSILTPNRRNSFSARVDHRIDKDHNLTARYSHVRVRFQNAGVGDFALPSRAFDRANSEQVLQLSETAVLSPSVVNVARLQYSRLRRELEGDNTVPALVVLDAFTGGGSQVGLTFARENRWELQDQVVWATGRHTVKFGARLRHESLSDSSPSNFGGTFTFAGGFEPQLDADNRPVLDASGQPVLVPITSIERYRRTLLFQSLNRTPEEIRALGGGATQFSISAGEPETSVGQFDVGLYVQDDWRVRPNLTLSAGLRYETQNNIGSNLNFAPRLSFAWAPRQGNRRQPLTVIRGGFGVFYERVDADLTLRARRFDGLRQQNFIINSPDFFPFVPSPETLAGARTSQTTRPLAGDLRTPYLMQFALGVERQLPHEFVLTTTYIRTRRLRGLRSRNVNAPLPGTFSPDDPESGLRPFGDIGNIFEVESTAVLNQQQLVFNLNGRFRRSLTVFATYALGKIENDALDFSVFPANSYDLRGEYGRSALDIRHRFTLGGTIRAPWDINLNPFIVAFSSRPFNITTGRDTNGDAIFAERPAFATDLSRPGVMVTPFGAFDPNPLPGQEIIPRNFGTAPAFFTTNLRISKVFSFGVIPTEAPAPTPPRPAAAAGRPGAGAAGAAPAGQQGQQGARPAAAAANRPAPAPEKR